jgi:hypothetical protein
MMKKQVKIRNTFSVIVPARDRTDAILEAERLVYLFKSAYSVIDCTYVITPENKDYQWEVELLIKMYKYIDVE